MQNHTIIDVTYLEIFQKQRKELVHEIAKKCLQKQDYSLLLEQLEKINTQILSIEVELECEKIKCDLSHEKKQF